jgi:preprotein translocase subunit YajC
MQPQPNFIVQLIPMVLIFGIFYFLIIRPEKKKQKDHQDLLKNLKKNDKVITSGGIQGVVVAVDDTTVVLRLDENCRVTFQKESVTAVIVS